MPVVGTRPNLEEIQAKLSGVPRPWYVDVGSGGDPVPFANILVDKFLGFTTHRTSPLLRDREQLIVQGDVMALPFEDHSVDFIWCSHVLEHLTDPEVGFNELQRVAKRGIVFLPTPFAETVYQEYAPGQACTHRWLCWSYGDKAIFLKCDTRDKVLTEKLLRLLGVWGTSSPQRTMRTETRVAWGWGNWPERITVQKFELDPSKEAEAEAWLEKEAEKRPPLDQP